MSSPGPIKRFYGKFRGTVTENFDPEGKGRILCMVPDVLGGKPSTWATPCVPFTGLAQTGMFVLPQIGANVWVEFEHGDSRYPIWSGGFWANEEQAPVTSKLDAPELPGVVIQTAGQNTVWISGDVLTGISLSCGPPGVPSSPGILISEAGVVIQDGKGGTITLADGIVTINLGALVVTQPV